MGECMHKHAMKLLQNIGDVPFAISCTKCWSSKCSLIYAIVDFNAYNNYNIIIQLYP